MKTLYPLIVAAMIGGSYADAQTATYVNYIKQIQYPTMLTKLDYVGPIDTMPSSLAIDPGGARFELWTLRSDMPEATLLDSSFVGTYIPVADVQIVTEDQTAAIPRTRVDRPFQVKLTVSGLLSGDDAPDAAKQVTFLRHVQSYGDGGTGATIDRTQATLVSQSEITQNGTQTFSFSVTAVPGSPRTKVRGEETFSVYSLEDYQAPKSQISTQTVQIWPIADGSIAGIKQSQTIRYALPQLTVTANDLYPNSTTYVQVYKGNPQLGVTGKILPGSAVSINEAAPVSRTLVVDKYDSVFDDDGLWTMELLTVTPFGIDRLSYLSFTLDRKIKMNGSFTTLE